MTTSKTASEQASAVIGPTAEEYATIKEQGSASVGPMERMVNQAMYVRSVGDGMKEINGLLEDARLLDATIAAQAQEIADLKEEIRKYGRHDIDCHIYRERYDYQEDCSCGFAKYLD